MKVFKRIKWSYVVLSAMFLLLGIYLVVNPETSLVMICRILGAAMAVFGVMKIVLYFIREVAAVTVPSLAADGMTLDMRWEPGEVEIEPDLFKTLMINLIDNARKASRKGQTVELFGKREEGGYAFYVRDHGRGMKKEDLSRITEPFYMIDKSRSRAQNGAGLGLALCDDICRRHGARLEIRSTYQKGTTIIIHMNVAPIPKNQGDELEALLQKRPPREKIREKERQKRKKQRETRYKGGRTI